HLPIDLERALAAIGFDPVVIADREHLLPHLVLRSAVVVVAVASQERHLESPFPWGANCDGTTLCSPRGPGVCQPWRRLSAPAPPNDPIVSFPAEAGAHTLDTAEHH